MNTNPKIPVSKEAPDDEAKTGRHTRKMQGGSTQWLVPSTACTFARRDQAGAQALPDSPSNQGVLSELPAIRAGMLLRGSRALCSPDVL
jgi:hypothetical protein